MQFKIDKNSPLPLYYQLMEQIRTQITDGILKPGTKLVTERQLMTDLELSYPTVTRAFRELVHQGLIERKQGSGSFVRDIKPSRKRIALVMPRLHMQGDSLSNIGLNISPPLVDAIEQEANKNNIDLMIYLANDDPRREKENLIKLMSRNVDGIILFYIGDEYNIDQLNKLYQTGIPVVLIDRYVPSIELDYVVTNNYKAAYSVVENLINSGFRNIYHFNHPLTTTSLVERKQGYLDAMNASSLDPTLILSNCKPKNEGWSHDGEKNVNEHYFQLVCDTLEFAESPFAFFFADSNFYLKTIKAIKLMKTPPVRYALACFDDPGLYFAPNCEMIIHVDQPLSEIGKRSVNIIIDKINGINIKRQEHLSPQIIVNRVEKIPV